MFIVWRKWLFVNFLLAWLVYWRLHSYNGLFSPGILLRALQILGDESKVLAHLQPQIRLWNPAIVSVDGMVLGQLPGDEPARQTGEKKREGLNYGSEQRFEPESNSLCSQTWTYLLVKKWRKKTTGKYCCFDAHHFTFLKDKRPHPFVYHVFNHSLVWKVVVDGVAMHMCAFGQRKINKRSKLCVWRTNICSNMMQ